MARPGVSLNWGGLGKALLNAAHNLADRQLLLEGVGEMLVSSSKKRFETEETPEGEKWEPSARAWEDGLARKGRKATEKRKAVRGRAESGKFGKTLTDTARLKKSIDYKTTDGAVLVGSTVAYARIHQLGGQAGRGVTLPARPYLGLSDEDREDVQELVADFVKDALTGGGQ